MNALERMAAALRQRGAEVQITRGIGHGFADLLALHRGRFYHLEVQRPKRGATWAMRWYRDWPGEIWIVRSIEQAVQVIEERTGIWAS